MKRHWWLHFAIKRIENLFNDLLTRQRIQSMEIVLTRHTCAHCTSSTTPSRLEILVTTLLFAPWEFQRIIVDKKYPRPALCSFFHSFILNWSSDGNETSWMEAQLLIKCLAQWRRALKNTHVNNNQLHTVGVQWHSQKHMRQFEMKTSVEMENWMGWYM